jgi:DNA-binding response OmpR family regulator
VAGARRAALMAALEAARGEWVSTDVLALAVYGGDTVEDIKTLHGLISAARRAHPNTIQSLYGVGYRLNPAKVRREA